MTPRFLSTSTLPPYCARANYCRGKELCCPVAEVWAQLFAFPMNLDTIRQSANNCLFQEMDKSIRSIRIITEEEQCVAFSGSKSLLLPGSREPQSEEDRLRTLPPGPNKVVEFEEFLPEEEKQVANSSTSNTLSVQRFEKHPRHFILALTSENNKGHQGIEEIAIDRPQEPPAPKNKYQCKPNAFVFPVGDPLPAADKKGIRQSGMTEREQDKTCDDLEMRWSMEREEFHREKSRLQRQLLVKESQLEILQKLLTSFVGSEIEPLELIANFGNKYYEQQLIEKENQISVLLAKITHLSEELTRRAEELAEVKDQCNRLTYTNQSLCNQLFIAQTIQSNAENCRDNKNSASNCSFQQQNFKGKRDFKQNRKRWDQNDRHDGLQLLYRRLDMLTHSRKELEEREKGSLFNRTFMKEASHRNNREPRLTTYSLKAPFC